MLCKLCVECYGLNHMNGAANPASSKVNMHQRSLLSVKVAHFDLIILRDHKRLMGYQMERKRQQSKGLPDFFGTVNCTDHQNRLHRAGIEVWLTTSTRLSSSVLNDDDIKRTAS